MRKILIIVENLPVPFDTRVWQEACTLVNNGYEVSVICPVGKGFEKEEETINGVHIFRHKMPKEGNGVWGYIKEYSVALWHEFYLAKKVYKKIGFDVIQACNPPDDIFLIANYFKRKGVRFVFDHHDICPELFEAKFSKKSGFLYKWLLFLERKTYEACTMAFVTNESYKEIAINRGEMNPDDVIVLRSGPDLKRLKIIPPKEKLKRNFRYLVGYLGVIGQQEGIEYIIQAAKYLKENGRSDILFAIVGGGPHLEYLKKITKDMSLDDCVVFTGRVSDQVLLEYLNTADVCVNSDVYNSMNDKSTMNKILEYMALKKPIVQFDLTEGKYSAQKASLYAKRNDYIDFAEKIVYLLDRPELRKEMGEFGYKRIVNELSWEHTSKALIEGYNKLFASM